MPCKPDAAVWKALLSVAIKNLCCCCQLESQSKSSAAEGGKGG